MTLIVGKESRQSSWGTLCLNAFQAFKAQLRASPCIDSHLFISGTLIRQRFLVLPFIFFYASLPSGCLGLVFCVIFVLEKGF